MGESMRVLVIDDHAIVRRGGIEIIREAFPAVIVGEAEVGAEGLQKCLSEAWDVVILDITLPVLSGFDILRQVMMSKPELCVIMLSLNLRLVYVTRAFELGAKGYVGKE